MQHVGLASFVLGCNCSITQSGRLPPPVSISHIFMGGDERQPLMASFVPQSAPPPPERPHASPEITQYR